MRVKGLARLAGTLLRAWACTRLWRVLLALAMAGLLVLSLAPPVPQMPTTGWDKSNHALGFLMLAVLGLQGWPGRALAVLGGLLAYGGLIEVLQSFTPDRMAEWADWGADAVGLGLGAIISIFLNSLVRKFNFSTGN